MHVWRTGTVSGPFARNALSKGCGVPCTVPGTGDINPTSFFPAVSISVGKKGGKQKPPFKVECLKGVMEKPAGEGMAGRVLFRRGLTQKVEDMVGNSVPAAAGTARVKMLTQEHAWRARGAAGRPKGTEGVRGTRSGGA